VRGRFDIDSKGAHVTPVGGHGSHLVGDLAEANALVVVPEDVISVAAGEHVQVMVLDRDF
jgi:molybdopterin molybdotransferase